MPPSVPMPVSVARSAAPSAGTWRALTAARAPGLRIVAPLSLCMAACTGSWAADTPEGLHAVAMASLPGRAAPALEYHTATYPQLPTAASLDAQQAAGGPAPALGGTLQSSSITRWMTPEQPRSLGVSLGVSTLSGPTAAAQPGATAALPRSLDMGVRWRSQWDTRRQLDVAAWARAPQNAPAPDAMQLIWLAQQPSYGTRVEMQWSSARTGALMPEFGAIGMQLESGSRLVLRAKRGKPMLYYRAKF
ncbi:hypothetical protein [Paracidovorax wautersii]|uniref:Toxin co-regulated pilus biosynthesis protein Q C-terminal domain-containing protein n=1 Tax=Paracidovorax wautersii TaxID=1177982 RepID=A0ABU1ID22_9BURK|nr:hypothetical protein [Paracidovorax wautersii]MDR6215130.1 hypothetical protein [Paracidovorax wautersii]